MKGRFLSTPATLGVRQVGPVSVSCLSLCLMGLHKDDKVACIARSAVSSIKGQRNAGHAGRALLPLPLPDGSAHTRKTCVHVAIDCTPRLSNRTKDALLLR